MSLYASVTGSGPDLVLLHGWGMHGGVWHGLVDTLSSRFRLHAIDLPGMGYSQAIMLPDDLRGLAACLATYLPSRSLICGWSLGGQLAMRLALDYPERVDALLLVGTTPRYVSASDWPHGVASEIFVQFATEVEQDYHGTMARFLGLQAFGGEAARDLIRILRARFAERPPPDAGALRAALQILLQTDLRSEIARLPQPVLLVHGDRDTLVPVGAAHWMAEHMPQAQLQVIAGASHAPFLSHPIRFVQVIDDFLATL